MASHDHAPSRDGSCPDAAGPSRAAVSKPGHDGRASCVAKPLVRSPSRHGDDTLQEIAALWERTSVNGRAYIGGRTPDNEDIVLPAGSMVTVYPNESANPRAPAFQLLFARRRVDQPHHPTDSGGATPARRKAGGEPLPPPAFRSRGTNPMAEIALPDILRDGEDPPF